MRLSSKSNTSSVIPPRWKFPASTRTRETRTRSQYWRLVPYQQSFVLGGTMHISPKNTQLQLKRNRTSWFGSFNTSMLPLPGTRLIRLSWCGIAVPWVFINASLFCLAFPWMYCTVHAPGKWQKRLTHDHSSMRYSPWVLYPHTKRIVGEVHVEGQVSSMHYAQRGVELKRSLPSHNHAKGIGEFQRCWWTPHFITSPQGSSARFEYPLPPIHRKNASQLTQHGQNLITSPRPNRMVGYRW